MATTIDTRGLFCPLPIAFVSRKLGFVPTGTRAQISADSRSFKLEMESWCFDTGNRLIDFSPGEGCYRALIQRGYGFHGDTLRKKIAFVLLGIKIHLTQLYTHVIPGTAPKYLLTFVSIAEGQRAHKLLTEQGLGGIGCCRFQARFIPSACWFSA